MITDVLIKTTDKCNLNCCYCYLQQKNTGEISFETIDNIADFLKYWTQMNAKQCLNVHLSGGEITMIPVVKVAYMLQEFKNKNIRLNLNTNGSFFTEKHAKLCKKYAVNMCLSIDGCKELHNAQRCESFDSTMAALELMRNHNLNIGHIAVVTEKSIPLLKENYDFFSNNNIKEIKMNPASMFITPENYYKYIIDFKQLNGGSVIEANTRIMTENKTTVRNTLGCAYGPCFSNFISINHNGDVTTCERLFGLPNAKDYVYGNINITAYNDLLWNPKRNNLIRKMYARKEECIACNVFQFCGNGCYHSYLLGESDICDGRKRFIEET